MDLWYKNGRLARLLRLLGIPSGHIVVSSSCLRSQCFVIELCDLFHSSGETIIKVSSIKGEGKDGGEEVDDARVATCGNHTSSGRPDAPLHRTRGSWSALFWGLAVGSPSLTIRRFGQ